MQVNFSEITKYILKIMCKITSMCLSNKCMNILKTIEHVQFLLKWSNK